MERPRWDAGRIAAVRESLAQLAASEQPPNTHPVRETFADLFGRWRTVANDPEPLLSTQIRSRTWLEHALPTLIAAADAVPADGDDLLHLDVRGDNLCFRDGAAILACSAASKRRGRTGSPPGDTRPARIAPSRSGSE